MTKIKFCGLRRGEDVRAVNGLMPDYVGFVLAQKSRRYVPPEAVRALREGLAPGILTVGVFVRAPAEDVAALLNGGVLDMAQLHGGEDDDYVRELKSLTDRPLIQAFRVSGSEDLRRARASAADMILLDHGPGGTGEAFDWSLLVGFDRPYFLAGGLNPGNVAEAIRALRPFAVDVSSGIETDGIKDAEKMRAFVWEVRDLGIRQ